LTVNTGHIILTSVTGFITLKLLNTNCKVWTCRVVAVGVAEAEAEAVGPIS
jgi:hypothetical protein